MKARPVVTSVSQATRLPGSCAISVSRTASEIWSAILSGCPSVTDSDVKRCRPFSAMPTPLRGPPGPAQNARAYHGGLRGTKPGVCHAEEPDVNGSTNGKGINTQEVARHPCARHSLSAKATASDIEDPAFFDL